MKSLWIGFSTLAGKSGIFSSVVHVVREELTWATVALLKENGRQTFRGVRGTSRSTAHLSCYRTSGWFLIY